LALAAEAVGTDAAREVAAVVREVAGVLRAWPDAREVMFRMIVSRSVVTGREEELFTALSECEEMYYRIGPSFGTDVEAWLERRGECGVVRPDS
jgi:hypothetical protein